MALLSRKLAGFTRPSYAYCSESSSLTNNSSYSFTSLSIGTADVTRIIACYIVGDKLTVNPSLSSVTIAGITATIAVNAGDVEFPTALAYAAVPTGTTGTVAVTWSQTVDFCGVGLYALYNVTPTPKLSGGKSSATQFPAVNFGANDIGLFFDWPGVACTWTNATENYDAPPTTANSTGASYQAGAAETRTVSNNYSSQPYGIYSLWGN